MAFVLRIRFAILALLLLATAGAAYWTFHGHAISLRALLLSSVSLAIGAAAAFVHLRHMGLALLVALAPVPGMIAAQPLGAELAFSGPLAVYGLGYLLASCLCGDIVRNILDGADRQTASGRAMAQGAFALAACLATGAALVLGWTFRDARSLGIGAAVEIAAAGLSVLLFVPFAAAVMPFGEPFFVTANRTRERRERWVRVASLVAQPRWGLSLSGIALVFVTLGWFGAAPLLAHNATPTQPVLWVASALSLFLAAFAIGRDWRDSLATTLALAALALVSLWLWGLAIGHLNASSFVEIATAAAAGLFVMLTLIDRSRRYRGTGDAAALARLRALEEPGLSPLFGFAGAAGAALPWIALHGSIAALVATILFSGAAGLLAMPAIATALDTLIRRRRSLASLYGRS